MEGRADFPVDSILDKPALPHSECHRVEGPLFTQLQRLLWEHCLLLLPCKSLPVPKVPKAKFLNRGTNVEMNQLTRRGKNYEQKQYFKYRYPNCPEQYRKLSF